MEAPKIKDDRDPVLLVGFRKPAGRLDVHRLQVHKDVFEVLRAPCVAAIDEISSGEPLTYAPYGALEDGEYYSLATSDLPTKPKGRRPRIGPDAREREVASLLQVVQDPAQSPVLEPGGLETLKLNFYCICLETIDGEYVGFVRQQSPYYGLRTGRVLLSYHDTLRRDCQMNGGTGLA